MSRDRVRNVRFLEPRDLGRVERELLGGDGVVEVLELRRADDRRGHAGLVQELQAKAATCAAGTRPVRRRPRQRGRRPRRRPPGCRGCLRNCRCGRASSAARPRACGCRASRPAGRAGSRAQHGDSTGTMQLRDHLLAPPRGRRGPCSGSACDTKAGEADDGLGAPWRTLPGEHASRSPRCSARLALASHHVVAAPPSSPRSGCRGSQRWIWLQVDVSVEVEPLQ